MCSIVGYIGNKPCKPFIYEGLQRLEYRGYDSAGIAVLGSQDNRIRYAKASGCLDRLNQKIQSDSAVLEGRVGIGHTRWATHGKAAEENAHPHFDCTKSIALVHNGIIENYHTLKKQLAQVGHVFYSQTDTEVIAHLFESLLTAHQTYKAAIVDLVKQLEGAYAFLALVQEHPDSVVVVRKRSPLCIGIGDGQMFLASDPLAFSGKTNKVFFLPDESFALVKCDAIELYDFDGNPLPVKPQELTAQWIASLKQGHDHYMLKEIHEQPHAITRSLDFYRSISASVWDHLGIDAQYIKSLQSISIIGCGTSWHAARIAQFFFESICKIPTRIFLASEFRYMPFFGQPNDLCIAVSQSGETADTLEALRMIKDLMPTVALTNVASSTMVREAGGFLLTQAGPEVSVASTKAFSTQLTAFYWLANRIALERGLINEEQMERAYEDVIVAAQVLENSIENYSIAITDQLACEYAKYEKFIFLGRHISYPFALEAALKLKEITYRFAQSYPAGELKHGPLALVDKQTPVVIFSHLDPVIYQKLLANVQEVRARSGHVVAFLFEGQDELAALAHTTFVLPRVNHLLTPLAMTGLMQFWVYQIARELGCPIDQPRNLAKSVTVE